MRLKHNRPSRWQLLSTCAHSYMGLVARATISGRWGRSPAGESMFVTYILSKIRAYKLYRQTVTALAELSDRELDDLGISRFQIARVARQAAFA